MEHKFAEIQGGGTVRRIALSNTLNAPLETVWQTLTSVEHIQHWWPDWRPGGFIDKAEGGSIRLGDGSWIDGVVKLWRPPHIFEFTWQEQLDEVPDWLEAATNSLLRIDLVELSNSQTLLNLVQFAPEQSVIGGTAGWHQFAGERLKRYLETGKVEDVPGRFEELVKLYEEAIPE